ncbi:MAG TPA: hypothetical protein ENI98_14000 [Gammaproteobacteria bacterium]|nr:hypothetical protein [Gammaproteobacteria bacterium]
MITKHFKSFLLLAISTIFLSGCGGGNSSSDGGSDISTISSLSGDSLPTQTPASNISLDISWEIDKTGGTTPSGFYLYFGKVPGNLTTYVDVGMSTLIALNGKEFQYEGSGTYYFSVVAYDANKILFSVPSKEKSITL